MIILYLASQLSAPIPDPMVWIRNNDYPMQHVQNGRSFVINLRATVRPDGTTQDCSIEKSSGDADFDKFNCALLIKRAKFAPATDSSGRPALGVFRTRINWVLDDNKLKGNAGDLELTIAKFPHGFKSPTWIYVAVAVDPAGQPSECASAFEEQNPAMVKAACAQLVRSYRAIPARLPSGEYISSVQSATVMFVGLKR